MINSLVITLNHDTRAISLTLGVLKNHPTIEIAQQFENRLPLTIAVADSQEMMSITGWIENLSGVLKADVVFVHFENEPTELIAKRSVVDNQKDSIEVSR